MKFVKIPGKDFEMGIYQMTQGEWRNVMSSNPSKFEVDQNPAVNVSFHDVQDFISRMNDLTNDHIYRLPTEEEWEYCCRAGSTTEYSFGDNIKALGDYAWFSDNSNHVAHPVGLKKPNAWGLYDMHGNVWEWCDSFRDKSASYRSLRGGSWFYVAQDLRSANRYDDSPAYRFSFVGFRLVRTPKPLHSNESETKIKGLELEMTTRELMKLLRNKRLKIKIEVIE